MRGDSGWRGGTISAAPTPSRCRASRQRHSGAILDLSRARLPPERLNLARYCLSGKPAEKTALIVAGDDRRERWSYGALEDVVLRLAQGLRTAGVEGGERLFIRMGNSLDFALLFFAANAAGAVPIPASPMLTVPEVDRLCRMSGARFMAWDGVLALPAG